MTSSPAPTVDRSASIDPQRYLPVAVCAVAFLAFIATLRFEFVYDDYQQIVSDPLIRSWHNLPLLLKTDVWRFWNPAVVGNYWRPLFMVWLLLNYKVFGLNAAGWHLTSVLVHVGATYLCYRLVKRVENDVVVAATAALIFAVHPVHLETVAWVSGVTDSLMSVFFLAALLCFIDGWESDRPGRYGWLAVSALLFACALLCKETAIVLPGVVVGYVVLFPRGQGRSQTTFLALAMYAAVAVAYWMARHAALLGINHSEVEIGATTLLLTWPSLLWFYLKHLLWPLGLSIMYDRPPVFHADGAHFWKPLLACAVVTLAITAGIQRQQRRRAVFALLLFLLPLGPAFFLPALFPTDYAHDRYLYLSCLGFAWLLAMILQRLKTNSRYGLGLVSARALATITIVICLVAATSAQVVYWANDVLLFDRATRIAPGNVRAFDGLAHAVLLRGRVKEAMFAFQQVLKADPQNWQALYNLGLNDFLNGNYVGAERYLRTAAQAKPNDADTWALLADSFNHLGKFGEAEPAIEHALALRPSKPGYRMVLATSLDGQGKVDEAIRELTPEVKAHPDEQEAAALLGRLEQENRADRTAKGRP